MELEVTAWLSPGITNGELGLIFWFRIGLRERWLEDIVKRTLKKVILVDAHPRTLVQATLQVIATPREEDVLRGLAQADSVGYAVLREKILWD